MCAHTHPRTHKSQVCPCMWKTVWLLMYQLSDCLLNHLKSHVAYLFKCIMISVLILFFLHFFIKYILLFIDTLWILWLYSIRHGRIKNFSMHCIPVSVPSVYGFWFAYNQQKHHSSVCCNSQATWCNSETAQCKILSKESKSYQGNTYSKQQKCRHSAHKHSFNLKKVCIKGTYNAKPWSQVDVQAKA